MGILDEYGIDTTNIEAPSYDIEDGWYAFTIGDSYVKEGSNANPDLSWLIIDYQLEDEDGEYVGKTSDLFQLPADPEAPTAEELKKLGWYVARMLNLGFKRDQINDIERDDLIGLTGVLQVATREGKGNNKGKFYQNIIKVTVNAEEKAEPAEETPAKTATKSAAKSGRAASTAPANPFAQKG
jgi:hypothetical protein